MGDYEGKGIWCIAETRRGSIAPTIFELLSAARKIAGARGSETVTAVLVGKGLAQSASEVAERGADRVLTLEHDALADFLDEAYSAALAKAAEAEKPRTILLPATIYGRSLAPRLAVALKSGLGAEAIGIEVDDQKRLVLTRSSYAGNVIAKVLVKAVSGPEMATVRPMAFERSGKSGVKAEIAGADVDPASWSLKSEFVSSSPDESGEIDMGGAERIVAGGRGLGKAEGFELLRKLAKSLGAAVGASRAAVDAGWIPYKHQVGLTGRSVRPKLYVACGISGQIQHLAGMNSSDIIVAVNTDPDCPMMKLATYAVQGDVYKVVPAFLDELQRLRGEGGPASEKQPEGVSAQAG
ncbi:MAG: electron transfer flavoprotein subunit alpha/FixB family protein [Elusimicrobiota bacterium]